MTSQPAHIKPLLLVFPFNQAAHYLRCLTLAQQLKPYFTILFAHSNTYASFIEGAGFELFPCANLDSEMVTTRIRKFDFSWINEAALEPVYQDQVAIIKSLKPVAVLGDTAPTLKMAAEKMGVRYIALTNAYMSKYYACVRKMSRTHVAYPYLHLLPEKLFDFLTRKGESVAFYQVHQPFRNLRKRHGLSKKFFYLDELEGDLNLICDLSSLFPLKKTPDHYKVIPPLFYEEAMPFADIKTRLDKGKKTIFVSMGSTGNWKAVRFLNEPYFQRYNIITAGDTEGLVYNTSVIRLDFANAQEVFPYTDLVICHGGNGTVYQTLSYGIPLLCKTAHFEQEWNVHRLQQLGLAQSLDAVPDTKAVIRYVEQWINKKGTLPFDDYKLLIAAAKQNFAATAQEIAAEILD